MADLDLDAIIDRGYLLPEEVPMLQHTTPTPGINVTPDSSWFDIPETAFDGLRNAPLATWNAAKGVGNALLHPVNTFNSAKEYISENPLQTLDAVGKGSAQTAGVLTGAGTGAAYGSMLGPVGAAAGGLIGGGLGYFAGSEGYDATRSAADTLSQGVDSDLDLIDERTFKEKTFANAHETGEGAILNALGSYGGKAANPLTKGGQELAAAKSMVTVTQGPPKPFHNISGQAVADKLAAGLEAESGNPFGQFKTTAEVIGDQGFADVEHLAKLSPMQQIDSTAAQKIAGMKEGRTGLRESMVENVAPTTGLDAVQKGEAVKNAITKNADDLKNSAAADYNAIDPNGQIMIPVDNAKAAIQRDVFDAQGAPYGAGRLSAPDDELASALKSTTPQPPELEPFPAGFRPPVEPAPPQVPEPDVRPFNSVKSTWSDAGGMADDAFKGGNNNKGWASEFIRRHFKGAADEAAQSGAFPPDKYSLYKQANDKWKEFKTNYDDGIIKKIRNEDIPSENITSKLTTDSAIADKAIAAVKGDAGALTALREDAIGALRAEAGKEKPWKFAELLSKRKPVLQKYFTLEHLRDLDIIARDIASEADKPTRLTNSKASLLKREVLKQMGALGYVERGFGKLGTLIAGGTTGTAGTLAAGAYTKLTSVLSNRISTMVLDAAADPKVAFELAGQATPGATTGIEKLVQALAMQLTEDPEINRILYEDEASGSLASGLADESFEQVTPDSPLFEKALDTLEVLESNGDPNAVSPVGAQGAYQLMPEIQKAFGVTDPFDPVQSRSGAAQLLAEELERFDGNLTLAVAAYNAGSPAVAAAVKRAGSTDWDDVEKFLVSVKTGKPLTETKAYVPKFFNQLG